MHGRRPLLLALTVVGIVSAALLFGTPRSAPIALLVPVVLVAGLGLIGWQGLWVTMIVEAAGPERAGAAQGFASTFVIATTAASAPIYGLVADTAGTYRAIWGVLTVVLVLALVPAFLVREPSTVR